MLHSNVGIVQSSMIGYRGVLLEWKILFFLVCIFQACLRFGERQTFSDPHSSPYRPGATQHVQRATDSKQLDY